MRRELISWALLPLLALLLGAGCITPSPPGTVSAEDHQNNLDYVAERVGAATGLAYVVGKDNLDNSVIEGLQYAYQGLTIGVVTVDASNVNGLPDELKRLVSEHVDDNLAVAAANEFIEIVWHEVEQRVNRHNLDDAQLVRFLIHFHQGLEEKLEELGEIGNQVAYYMTKPPGTRLVAFQERPTPRWEMTPVQEDMVVLTVLAEARGEGPKGMRAVAWVIRNRADMRNRSPHDIVQEPGQFALNCGHDACSGNLENAQKLLKANTNLVKQARVIWRVVNSSASGEDETNGALFFKAVSQDTDDRSIRASLSRDNWHMTYRYKHHVFYRTAFDTVEL
jgi:hypothetical protein